LPLRPTSDRLLALLGIWALLLFHGVFAALHLIPDPVLQPIATGEHATTHHPSHAHGGAPEERPAPHHTDAEYFALLLGTFLGGLAFWLLIRNYLRARPDPFRAALRRFVPGDGLLTPQGHRRVGVAEHLVGESMKGPMPWRRCGGGGGSGCRRGGRAP
jgi:hypothetical protein